MKNTGGGATPLSHIISVIYDHYGLGAEMGVVVRAIGSDETLSSLLVPVSGHGCAIECPRAQCV